MNKRFSALFIFLIFIFGISFLSTKSGNKNISLFQPSITPKIAPIVTTVPILGKQTKTSGCITINGLPDKECTPGDIDPRVTQDNINQTICVSGYTKTVRPPVSYTNKLKIEQIAEYEYTNTNLKDYEEDHMIPLELGGSPTSKANLWPESYSPTPGSHEKDTVENYLHQQVCEGQMSLQEAQMKITENWEEVYKQRL